MQVFFFHFTYLISKFSSLRKPKIKFYVQKAIRWSVPEIGSFCILRSMQWKLDASGSRSETPGKL
jgi:hypothetical protein